MRFLQRIWTALVAWLRPRTNGTNPALFGPRDLVVITGAPASQSSEPKPVSAFSGRIVDQVQLVLHHTKEPRIRNTSDITHVVIHRFGPIVSEYLIEDAVGASRVFMNTEQYAAGYYTGGAMAYHWVYDPRTQVLYKALEAYHTGAHAKGYNRVSVAVCILHDFRKAPVENDELPGVYDAVRHVVYDAQSHAGRALKVAGHTELAGAAANPRKECPGKHLDMGALRDAIT